MQPTDSEEIEDVCLSQWTNSMAGLLAVQGRDHICTASRSCLAVIRDISCCFKGVGTVTFCFVNHHPYPPPPPPYTPLPATPTYPYPPPQPTPTRQARTTANAEIKLPSRDKVVSVNPFTAIVSFENDP